MKTLHKLLFVGLSTCIALCMFIASIILITHITGLVASTLMIIFNTLFIIYTLKFKKRLKSNYKK